MIISLVLSLYGWLVIRNLTPSLSSQVIIYLIIGLIAFLVISRIGYHWLADLNWWLYLAIIIGLIIPLIFGQITRGAIRWIQIGSLSLQLSEIIKPFIIIFLANFLIKNQTLNFKKYLNLCLLFLLPLILIFIQPDLGSCFLLIIMFGGMLIFSQIPKKYLITSLLIILILLPVTWKFMLHDYQKQRLTTFLNPNFDPLATGYNLVQAKIALGSGQLFGRGLGQGSQSQLRFLPEKQTDFIFSAIGEELGLVGSLLLIILWILLLIQILKISQAASEPLGQTISLAIFCLLTGQVFLNLGMNLGLLPIAGVTLPLVSYGGSSYLSTMICLGLVNSLSRLPKSRPMSII